MERRTRPTRRTDQIRDRRSKAGQNNRKTAPQAKKTWSLKDMETFRPAGRPRKLNQPARKRVQKSADYAPPPVMVRGSAASKSWAERKPSRKSRRRYDVALNVPGAEIRLPSLPQLHVGWWRLISAGLVILLAFLLYNVWNSPNFRVEEAEVTGLSRLSSRDVNAALGISDEPVFTLDPAEMRQNLLDAFPEFSAVSVHVGLPDSLVITVTERIPVITWRQDGKTELVDAEGVAFPLREGAKTSPELVVEAASTPRMAVPSELDAEDVKDHEAVRAKNAARQFLTREMVLAIQAMSVQAPQGTPLVYDALHGLGWKDRRGWDVYFGDTDQIDEKLHVYQALVKRLKAEEIQPVLISVEFVHAPYYRVD